MLEVATHLQRLDIAIATEKLSISTADKADIARRLIEKRSRRTRSAPALESLVEILLGHDPAASGHGDAARKRARHLNDIWAVADHTRGLYSQASHEILINAALHPQGRGLEYTIAHELGHAHEQQLIQGMDQQIDPPSMDAETGLASPPRTVDQRLARAMLSEGYAQLVGLSLLLDVRGRKLSQLSPTIFATDPTAGVAEPMQFGTGFALARFKAGGWPEVHRALLSGPRATEQLLHDDKYRRDEPTEIPADTQLLADDHVLVADDSLGELGIVALMRLMGVGGEAARRVGVGWDGDALRLYDKHGAQVLVWRSVWDRRVDALQFHAALLGIGPPALAHSLHRRGTTVDLMIAPSSDDPEQLRATLEALPELPSPTLDDRRSSARAEARILAGLRGQPSVAGERLRIATLGLSLSIRGWDHNLDAIPVWLSRDGNIERGLMTISWRGNPQSRTLAEIVEDVHSEISRYPGYELELDGPFELGGTPAHRIMWRESGGTGFGAQRHRQMDLLFLSADRIGRITVRASESAWGELSPALEQTWASAKIEPPLTAPISQPTP